jgi:uncharacterized protein YjiS (DUF1127 family)
MKQTAFANMQVPGVQQHFFSVTNQLMARIRKTVHTWYQRHTTRTELAQLSWRELDDVGITVTQRRVEIKKPFWKA